MNPLEFLTAAETWSRGPTEAEWRTSVSRAYYALFHLARKLMAQCGFLVPKADRAHSYLWLRLSHAGHPDVQQAGGILDSLRRTRNQADYDIDWPFGQATAIADVLAARNAIPLLGAAAQEPIKTQITEAIKIYERDVLRDVTWHP